MLITYYEDGTAAPKQTSRGMAVLMGVNAAITLSILFAWTYVALFVAEPLAWATWMPVSRGYGLNGVFDYPFLMLWILPALGVFGAWVGLKGGKKGMAWSFLAIPPVMMLLILGWFYLAPPDWR